jgi:hypothetical protein
LTREEAARLHGSGEICGAEGCDEEARGKRNEEQRRRARGRIHGNYKAVGANLRPKGRMARRRKRGNSFPA